MIINKKNETELSGLYFIYEGSTLLEKKTQKCLAHYGEHIKCKCYDDMMDILQENGISYNAYTSSNKVVFYFTGLEEYLAPLRGELITRMYKSLDDYMTIEDFEKEKSIVLEEYQESFSDQMSAFYQNYFRHKYNYASPIGLKEDIENLDIENFKEFYNRQYLYPSKIINISKTFELNSLLNFNTNTEVINSESGTMPLEFRGDFPENDCIIYDQTIEKEDVTKVKILSYMLGSGLNSPLYQEIREKRALCYGVSIFTYRVMDKELLILSTNTSPKNLEEMDSTIKEILDNPTKYLTKERLELIRKEKLINKKKSLINRHENISDIIDPAISEMYSIIENVSLEDLEDVYNKYFRLEIFERTTDKDLLKS